MVDPIVIYETRHAPWRDSYLGSLHFMTYDTPPPLCGASLIQREEPSAQSLDFEENNFIAFLKHFINMTVEAYGIRADNAIKRHNH